MSKLKIKIEKDIEKKKVKIGKLLTSKEKLLKKRNIKCLKCNTRYDIDYVKSVEHIFFMKNPYDRNSKTETFYCPTCKTYHMTEASKEKVDVLISEITKLKEDLEGLGKVFIDENRDILLKAKNFIKRDDGTFEIDETWSVNSHSTDYITLKFRNDSYSYHESYDPHETNNMNEFSRSLKKILSEISDEVNINYHEKCWFGVSVKID